jgi:hypothetical protein
MNTLQFGIRLEPIEQTAIPKDNLMELLPAQALPAVPHLVFGIFNLAIPNILAWAALIAVFLAAGWVRLPRVFEPDSDDERSAS